MPRVTSTCEPPGATSHSRAASWPLAPLVAIVALIVGRPSSV